MVAIVVLRRRVFIGYGPGRERGSVIIEVYGKFVLRGNGAI
jgi:hypothetical protein